MLTCYDATFASLFAQTDIDLLLVGDSVAMVVHGYESTVNATIGMMKTHTHAVKRACGDKPIVSDVPFLEQRKGKYHLADASGQLMRAGADAVKIEGSSGHLDSIAYTIESGIPVMGHLGLTPQYVHQLGGYKVQGREERAQEQMRKDARALQDVGCFSLVLECVPAQLAKQISEELTIPVIGIGAGVDCDGQVLVCYDMLGLQTKLSPRFVRRFAELGDATKTATTQFHQAIKNKEFPTPTESYK